MDLIAMLIIAVNEAWVVIWRMLKTLCAVYWQVLREKIRRHIIVPAKRQLI